MNWWPIRREERIAARPAVPADRAAVSALMARTWRKHGRLVEEDQVALLQEGCSAIAFSGAEPVGFLGLSERMAAGSPPERWVDVHTALVEANRAVLTVLRALLEVSLVRLSDRSTGLVCLTGIDWLRDGLERSGFTQADLVLSYSRQSSPKLPVASRVARLRPASAADAETILSLNAASFDPFWQYSDATVVGWLLTSERAALAYLDDKPVGFALTARGILGSYAHLIRVATHPEFRGRGVGRQLVADAIQFANEAGAPGLALNTQVSNKASRRLYESMSFRPTGQAMAVMVYRLQ